MQHTFPSLHPSGIGDLVSPELQLSLHVPSCPPSHSVVLVVLKKTFFIRVYPTQITIIITKRAKAAFTIVSREISALLFFISDTSLNISKAHCSKLFFQPLTAFVFVLAVGNPAVLGAAAARFASEGSYISVVVEAANNYIG